MCLASYFGNLDFWSVYVLPYISVLFMFLLTHVLLICFWLYFVEINYGPFKEIKTDKILSQYHYHQPFKGTKKKQIDGDWWGKRKVEKECGAAFPSRFFPSKFLSSVHKEKGHFYPPTTAIEQEEETGGRTSG